MPRFLKKPASMPTKACFARFVEINEVLKFYPLHPGILDDVDKFTKDKLLDILEFTYLYEWKREMVLQDFDLVVSTLDAFTSFCKRFECKYPHIENKSQKTNHDKTSTTKHKKCDGQMDAEKNTARSMERAITLLVNVTP